MQLHVEFMNAPRGSLTRAANAVKKADGGIFWWSVAIVILMALAAFSWIGSIFVFTHPERPFNYQLLSRIQRLEEIKLFTEKDIPTGKSLTPPELFQKFYPFTGENLANHNELLRRNYITNYKSRDEKPYYVRGRFKVVHARPLTGKDLFPSGLVHSPGLNLQNPKRPKCDFANDDDQRPAAATPGNWEALPKPSSVIGSRAPMFRRSGGVAVSTMFFTGSIKCSPYIKGIMVNTSTSSLGL